MSDKTMTDKPDPRTVKLVRSAYQPSTAEMREPIELPEELTPEDLAKAVVAPAKIKWTDRPE